MTDAYEEFIADIDEGDDEDVEDQDAAAEEGDDGEGSEDSAADGTPDAKDKRINDLMSKWQKAEARNKQLEAASAAKRKETPSATDSDPNVWVEFMQEQARDTIYSKDPRLAQYGIEPSAIDGDTPAAMKASAEKWGLVMDKIEASAGKATLKKAGLTPDIQGSAAAKAMVIPDDDDAFEAMVAKARSAAGVP